MLALPPERERAFLAPLPIDLLDPGDALAEALTRFGVHTVRDLLALPRRGLATRLGAGALELLRMACGEAVETPLPEAPDLAAGGGDRPGRAGSTASSRCCS